MTTGPISLRQDWQHTDGRAHMRLVDSYDAVTGVTKIAMLVYDVGSLGWIPYTGGGSGGGGAVTIANGSDVATGTTSDAAWVSGSGTVIAILKKIASAGGSAVSVADGSDVAEGTTTDVEATGNGSVIAILKRIRTLLGGTLTVSNGQSQPLTDAQLRASVVPVSTANLDVALSTRTKPSDQQHVIVDTLPTGLATSSGQATEHTDLAALLTELVLKARLTDTQPVSAAALPLPTGASTEGTLLLIKALLSGTLAIGGTVTVVDSVPLSVSQSSQPLPTNAAIETGGNLASIAASQTSVTSSLATLVLRTTPGQALANASAPVVLATDQSTIESRYVRGWQEESYLQSLDLAASASRGRGSERITFADRRGRTDRGTAR